MEKQRNTEFTNSEKVQAMKGGGKIIGGLISRLGGYDKKAEAALQNLNRAQRDFNLREIERAYDINYDNLMDGFIDNRAKVSFEASKAIGKLALATSTKSAVDVTESSFNYEDAKAKVNQEFLENINDLAELQIQQAGNLMGERMAQEQSANRTFSRTSNNLSNALLQSKLHANSQIIEGVGDIAEAAMKGASAGAGGGM